MTARTDVRTEIPIEQRYAAALIYATVVDYKEAKWALPQVKTAATLANEEYTKVVRTMIELRSSINRARDDIVDEGPRMITKTNHALDEANDKIDKARLTLDAAIVSLNTLNITYPFITRALDDYYKEIDLHMLEKSEEISRESRNHFSFRADSLRHELEATERAYHNFDYEHRLTSSELAKRRRMDHEQATKK